MPASPDSLLIEGAGSAPHSERREPTALPAGARRLLLLLAASVALMMTGYGMVVPVFAKRLGEIGGGVEALGLMTMAFALAQMMLAPFMGTLADRFGRRPLILLSLGGVVVANLGFVLVDDIGAYVVLRFVHGAITAGLLPAAMGVVADVVPEERRAEWTGIVMGSYGIGFIVGPTLGGVLYDVAGFVAPFAATAALGLFGLLFTWVMLPETRPAAIRRAARATATRGDLVGSLPRPLTTFATLLLLDFLALFVFAFIEPPMVFYFYDELGFSTTQFGLIVGIYGLAMVVAQATTGRFADRVGRRPMIALGFALNVPFYAGLLVFRNFEPMLVTAAVAGLGLAAMTPALSALYLDLSAEAHRSRVMGFKESATALGGVAGPLLVALVSRWTTTEVLFAVSAVLTGAGAVLALTVLREKPRAGREPGRTVEKSQAAGDLAA